MTNRTQLNRVVDLLRSQAKSATDAADKISELLRDSDMQIATSTAVFPSNLLPSYHFSNIKNGDTITDPNFVLEVGINDESVRNIDIRAKLASDGPFSTTADDKTNQFYDSAGLGTTLNTSSQPVNWPRTLSNPVGVYLRLIVSEDGQPFGSDSDANITDGRFYDILVYVDIPQEAFRTGLVSGINPSTPVARGNWTMNDWSDFVGSTAIASITDTAEVAAGTYGGRDAIEIRMQPLTAANSPRGSTRTDFFTDLATPTKNLRIAQEMRFSGTLTPSQNNAHTAKTGFGALTQIQSSGGIHNSAGFSIRPSIRGFGDGTPGLDLYAYLATTPGSGEPFGEELHLVNPDGSRWEVPLDTWFDLIIDVELNTTASASDGKLTAYVSLDGVNYTQMYSRTGMQYYSTGAGLIDRLGANWFWGGPDEEWRPVSDSFQQIRNVAYGAVSSVGTETTPESGIVVPPSQAITASALTLPRTRLATIEEPSTGVTIQALEAVGGSGSYVNKASLNRIYSLPAQFNFDTTKYVLYQNDFTASSFSDAENHPNIYDLETRTLEREIEDINTPAYWCAFTKNSLFGIRYTGPAGQSSSNQNQLVEVDMDTGATSVIYDVTTNANYSTGDYLRLAGSNHNGDWNDRYVILSITFGSTRDIKRLLLVDMQTKTLVWDIAPPTTRNSANNPTRIGQTVAYGSDRITARISPLGNYVMAVMGASHCEIWGRADPLNSRNDIGALDASDNFITANAHHRCLSVRGTTTEVAIILQGGNHFAVDMGAPNDPYLLAGKGGGHCCGQTPQYRSYYLHNNYDQSAPEVDGRVQLAEIKKSTQPQAVTQLDDAFGAVKVRPVDATSELRPFCFHRTTGVAYNDQPQATVSMDGRYAMFNSSQPGVGTGLPYLAYYDSDD